LTQVLGLPACKHQSAPLARAIGNVKLQIRLDAGVYCQMERGRILRLGGGSKNNSEGRGDMRAPDPALP